MPQCQLLFFAVFVFQKSCIGNILGIARDKLPLPYNHVMKTVPEDDLRGASQVARPHPGAARAWPAPGWRLGPPWRPRLRIFAYLFSVSGKNLEKREKFHKKFRSRRHQRTRLGRVLELIPAPCRREKSPPEAFFIAMPAS